MAFHYSMLFLSHKMLAEKKVVGRRKGREGGKKRQEVGAWGGGGPGLAGRPLCCPVPRHHSAPVFMCAERVCNCYLAESLKGFNEMTYERVL